MSREARILERSVMMQRIAAFALSALVLATGGLLVMSGGVSAQADDLGGRVMYVDTWAKTVTFSDGRIVHYNPQWRILVNGHEVALTDVQPGAVVAVVPSSSTARVVVPGTPRPAMAQATIPGSATVPPPAVVKSIDETTHTIILEDGRVVKTTEVQVWRHDAGALRPGSQVYVTTTPIAQSPGATAVVATPSTAPPVAWSTSDREMRGRVTRVTPTGHEVLLADGRTVIVSPSTTVRTVNAQTVTMDELRPGDEVSIQIQQVVPVAGLDTTTTDGAYRNTTVRDRHAFAPSYRYPGSAEVAADRVLIVRTLEAL
jgi:hypothetical protein